MSGRGRGRVGADLVLGARLALSGGRSARLRALMTAIGVGLGVALLLGAASVPTMFDRSQDRSAARSIAMGPPIERGNHTLLIATTDTTFRGNDIRGRALRPEGPNAPVPPGVSALPKPGEMVASPRLRQLLASPGGALLRARLGARVVGTIGPAGLRGPAEYAFYRGDGTLRAGPATRIDHFGSGDPRPSFGPLLTLLGAVGVVALLLPVAVFVAAAVRFGGEDRDRRLAALRLIGADRAMAARIAAGETLLGALLGLAVGLLLFLGLRPLVEHVSVQDISVYASDVRPSVALAALILVLVPVAAVMVSLLALRRVVIEPLGVVRRAEEGRRRLGWRLVPAAVGVALLVPLHGHLLQGGAEYQAAGGVLLVLVGVTAVLPWLVEITVRRLGAGPLSWQLATRRLQVDGGTAARVVGGIAVAVAGAIALQTVFTVAERQATTETHADLARAQLEASVPLDARRGVTAVRLVAELRAAPGVQGAEGFTQAFASAPGGVGADLYIGSCAALRELVVVGRCRDGDTFRSAGPGEPVLRPGTLLRLGGDTAGGASAAVRWRLPRDARQVPGRLDPRGARASGLFVTPSAIRTADVPEGLAHAFVRIDRRDPDAVEQVRNAAARVSELATVDGIETVRQDEKFTVVRRVLFAAATAVLLLIGASLLVGAAEQLRERRRVLAVLVAFGTRRTTLATSVLWQTAVPVVLGLAVSVTVGVGLGALLLSIGSQPLILDWGAIAAMTGAGGAVVLLVTLLSMPALWRLMRADGLRTE